MRGIDSRRTVPKALLAGAVILALGASPARAQWGWGLGFGGFNYVSQPTDFLNQKALIDATRDTGRPSFGNAYQGASDPYYLHARDNGFVPSYDVERRQPTASRGAPAPYSSERPRPVPSSRGGSENAAGGVPRPVVPLASFFDPSHRLVWPGDAPVAGDLKQLRADSDKACLVALEETNIRGRTSIATAADARQKLLEYGQPALKELRTETTPRVADTFHLFLLSLYESLAQATEASGTASSPPPR